MTEDLFSQQENQEIPHEEINLSRYEVVRREFFAHVTEPSVTFNNGRFYVNTACLRKLPTVDYVQILISPNLRKLVVRPCREDEKDSFLWCSVSEKRRPKQLACKVFFAKVFELMEWSMEHRYKVLGKLIRTEKEYLFVFDLKERVVFPRSMQQNGKSMLSKMPSYPAEWKNQFGLPFDEHQKQLQVNIVNGFCVLSLTDQNQILEKSINRGDDDGKA